MYASEKHPTAQLTPQPTGAAVRTSQNACGVVRPSPSSGGNVLLAFLWSGVLVFSRCESPL